MQQQLWNYRSQSNINGWWVISHEGKLWLPEGELPFGSATQFSLTGKTARQIGEWQGEPVWLVRQACTTIWSRRVSYSIKIADYFSWSVAVCNWLNFIVLTSFVVIAAMKCKSVKLNGPRSAGHCRERYYPQIAPCIIVAIRRGDEILLAQHVRHRNGIHTVLGGFVEVRETLEETVAREVMEESNVRVKNVRYVSSQPWPFPNSLMMAFMADYDSGDIRHDPKELLNAGWYRYDALPMLPPPGTIARRLIEDTVALCRAASDEDDV